MALSVLLCFLYLEMDKQNVGGFIIWECWCPLYLYNSPSCLHKLMWFQSKKSYSNQFLNPEIISKQPLYNQRGKFNSVQTQHHGKDLSSCICLSRHLILHKTNVSFVRFPSQDLCCLSRLSQGWADCGGSYTLFGSMSGVYMLESTSSSAPELCLAKLLKMSMNHEEQLTHMRRGMTRMTRSSLNSHPVF